MLGLGSGSGRGLVESPAGGVSDEASGIDEGGAGNDGAAESALKITAVRPHTDIALWMREALASDGEHPLVGLWVDGQHRPARGDATRVACVVGDSALVMDTGELSPTQDQAMGQVLAELETLVVHDGKGAWHALKGRGWEMALPVFDVELAAYLLRPEQRSYDLEALATRYLRLEVGHSGDEDALFDLGELSDQADARVPTATERRIAESASVVLALRDVLATQLDEQGASELLMRIELPVQGALEVMEDIGIAMDTGVLAGMHAELAHGVERAAESAYEAIGHRVNLSSPKQLQEVLFDELDMPRTKKTKTGWTTNAEALQDLFAKTGHPFLEHLLMHRDRIKLLQMVETLEASVLEDSRIHTTFSQVVAATGRLASSEPNLQNIPARTADGLRIRHAFVAGPGYEELMSADYSQIEMRIMAHLSQDAALIDAFNSGEDLHRTMAAMVFATPVQEVTGEQRSRIKATSYGLAYGLSSYGLSQQLGIGVPEAADLKDRYFERFGGIRDYLASIVAQARRDGYTETMFHRRRYLPDLRSENRQRREMAERAALNAPIQGSAADIIKIAMVNVSRAFEEAGLSTRILVQIHDELLIEVAPGERDAAEAIVRKQMASPVHMDVPLDVAVGFGHSWMEAAH